MNTGKEIAAVFNLVTQEGLHELDDLWDRLPEMVSGEAWHGEVVDAAQRFSEWLKEEREYSIDDLQDITSPLADGEIEDYYSTINTRVQELRLWAYTELDDEVRDLNAGAPALSLTDLNSQYLWCAMRGLYDVLAVWAYDRLNG